MKGARRAFLKQRVLPLALAVFLAFAGYGAQCGTPGARAAATRAEAPPVKVAPTPPMREDTRPAGVKSPSVPPPPSFQMMHSAGRDALKPQPEAGFTLSVPDGAYAGEPFAVAFGGAGLQSLSILWRGKTLLLKPRGDGQGEACQALLSVPLEEKAPGLPLVFGVLWKNGKQEEYRAEIPVLRRGYPVQRLKVDPRYVTPPAGVLERIKQDRARMRAVLASSSPVKRWTLPMERPVPGEVTSLYGLRRVFNGQERNPHKGIDFDAKTGDPVAACDAGTVVLAEEQYYGGNTVVIDHGLYVFSIYLHLSAMHVAVGDTVGRGQIIGLIGGTGRVTGPHLHLSLSVLGESVNAAKVLEGMGQVE